MQNKKSGLPKRRFEDLVIQVHELDKIAINVRSHILLKRLLKENRKLNEIMRNSSNEIEALEGVEQWARSLLDKSPDASAFYYYESQGRKLFELLKWRDYAAIRLLDYVRYAGEEYEDLNLRGEMAVTNPIKMLWLATKLGIGGAKPYFFQDMLHLFRQINAVEKRVRPSRDQVEEWMERWPTGLDLEIVNIQEENKKRILGIIIKRIDSGEIKSRRFFFEEGLTDEQKYSQAIRWWGDSRFHLNFAIRSPALLNEMMGWALDPDTMKILYQAEKTGLPFFINLYYLSLLHIHIPSFAVSADLAIRDYVIYSRKLVDEFGHILAWEKEDQVRPGKPNAAGWILPSEKNVHRRYPEVAILIPDTVGRACGGLCASCQRMYDFQGGHLNFDLEKLKPKEAWPDKLKRMMDYFENDSHLRDILITGGDALMSSDRSLEIILDAVYDMALRKIEANKERSDGEKYAEILRVRLGTRLPVYLPQRITENLVDILARFKEKAEKIGIKQFVVQTHFISPLEVTPASREAVARLILAGWSVTNQHVLTTSSSSRGHVAKLRQTLNKIGVICYYTFTVKGYMENQANFATNARAVQEQMEEKVFGVVPEEFNSRIENLSLDSKNVVQKISEILSAAGLPFLATDRNVINLPAVGKSLTFRVIGLTRYGRRILAFEHDATRTHSPIVANQGKVIIIESKSISEYLAQIKQNGEDINEYESIWGYSLGETEPRSSIFEYPDYRFKITKEYTNLVVD